MLRVLDAVGAKIEGHIAIQSCLWIGNASTTSLKIKDRTGQVRTRTAAPSADVVVFPGGIELTDLEVVVLGGGVLEVEYTKIGG